MSKSAILPCLRLVALAALSASLLHGPSLESSGLRAQAPMHAMSQVAQLHMAQSSSATKNASESKVGDKAKTSGAKSSKKQRDDKGDKKDKKPSWPRLKFVRKNITKDKIPLLVSKKQDKRKDARERILSYGAGTCPVLLDSLHDKTSPELAEELRSLLDELTTKQHAPLLAESFSSRNLTRSRWITQRLASFELREMAEFFRKAAKHEDVAIRESAWFALARLGDLAAMPFLLEMAGKHWDERNLEIREVLPSFKGKDATKELATRLVTSKDVDEQIACLRLLAGCGTKDAVSPIASMLNSSNHHIRVATVNALRGIVDGQRPYANLTVFNAITEVKKWKARLGR
jgi:HEAT repeat protein